MLFQEMIRVLPTPAWSPVPLTENLQHARLTFFEVMCPKPQHSHSQVLRIPNPYRGIVWGNHCSAHDNDMDVLQR